VITEAQYFAAKPHTLAQYDAAVILLGRVNRLLDEAEAVGPFRRRRDPDTGTEISGARGGSGDGGFRMSTSTTGKVGSAHKCLPANKPEGAAVDPYDPGSHLDNWLDKFETGNGGNSKLEEYGLYREHPDHTRGGTPEQDWCHLQTRPVASGRRTFRV
jgi:hypothetical protein